MKFGAHMSTSGGVWKALERGASVQCEVVQIFVKNNMQWLGKAYAQADVDQFQRERKASKFAAVFGHTGYLINLGAGASEKRDKSVESLIQEMTLAGTLGLPFLVLHPGAHLGAGEEAGLKQIVAGLDEVLAATPISPGINSILSHSSHSHTGERLSGPVRIALENTAGQGSCLGYKIEHLAAIFDRVQCPERLGVCLDTAHFLASGYDIRTPEGWETAIKQVDALIGIKQVLAFHLNDSKTELGSRVDRHEHIGKGKIGLEAFRHIVNDPRFKNTPGCLETPKSEDMREDKENLAVLRSLVI